LYNQTLLDQSANYVETGPFRQDQIVTAVIDRIPSANQDAPGTVVIAGQPQAADDTVAIEGPMIQSYLLTKIPLFLGQIDVCKQMAAKVLWSLKARQTAL
jgi:hypothetical protein